MFKLKLINKPKMMKLKCNFTFPNVVLANLQEKEATPTKEMQQIIADQQYDGLSKVTVNPIPDEYIIPNGDINIIENGTYDVTDKINAIVNIPEKKLGTKTITKNGTYKASDDNLDGYSEVEVATSGVDINDYYVTSITSSGNININYYIKAIPQLDTSNVTDMRSMFYDCKNLISIPLLDTSNVTDMNLMFRGCTSLTTIPQLDTRNVIYMNQMFWGCTSLTTIPQLDTRNVTIMHNMFNGCKNLISIPQLDTSNVIGVDSMLYGCTSLTTLGGFQNLGMAYDTTASANYRNYRLDLSTSSKLTHDSLMNVINGLYDIKTKGCNPQQLILGSVNLAKLTAEEIAIATNKGFNVS